MASAHQDGNTSSPIKSDTVPRHWGCSVEVFMEGRACLFLGLAHASSPPPPATPPHTHRSILYFLAESCLSELMMKPFLKDQNKSQRKNPQKKSESFSWEFKALFYPRAYDGLLTWRSFRKLLEATKSMGFLEAVCVLHVTSIKQTQNRKHPRLTTQLQRTPSSPRRQTHSAATIWGMGSPSSSKLCRIQ